MELAPSAPVTRTTTPLDNTTDDSAEVGTTCNSVQAEWSTTNCSPMNVVDWMTYKGYHTMGTNRNTYRYVAGMCE